MIELGMDNIDAKPTNNLFEKNVMLSSDNNHKPSKEQYVRRLAASVVDKYIMNGCDAKQIVSES